VLPLHGQVPGPPAERSSPAIPRQRSAATATDRASPGSFLFVFPDASNRTRAAIFGWTSSTTSPAVTSCWASSFPSPLAPSTAQVPSGHAAAHASSCAACDATARTWMPPSGSSAGPIAAAVCDALCGSTPIITAAINGLLLTLGTGRNRGGHA
jgi:hypothetical protein